MATVHQFFAHIDGPHQPFIGNPEDCGYTQKDDGTWYDMRGNTGEMCERPLSPTGDLALLLCAYAGEDRVDDWDHFREWAAREVGLTASEIEAAVREACVQEAVDLAADMVLKNPERN